VEVLVNCQHILQDLCQEPPSGNKDKRKLNVFYKTQNQTFKYASSKSNPMIFSSYCVSEETELEISKNDQILLSTCSSDLCNSPMYCNRCPGGIQALCSQKDLISYPCPSLEYRHCGVSNSQKLAFFQIVKINPMRN
jgi:hypothetical protein